MKTNYLSAHRHARTHRHTHTQVPVPTELSISPKSPFTHRPSNTDGLTFPEKVRDLLHSHDQTEQVYSCCMLSGFISASKYGFTFTLKSYFVIVSVLAACAWCAFVMIINSMTVSHMQLHTELFPVTVWKGARDNTAESWSGINSLWYKSCVNASGATECGSVQSCV